MGVDASSDGPADVRIRSLVSGYRISQLLYAAVRVGLPDALATGPRTPAELAGDLDVRPDVLDRALGVLASVEVVAAQPDGRIRLTEVGDLLRSDHPDTLAPWTITVCEEQYLAWSRFEHTLRTGRAAFPEVFGTDFWSYLTASPQAADRYGAGMNASLTDALTLLASSCDLTSTRRIADLGGGHGTVLVALLRAHPDLTGVLLERSEAARHAREAFHRAGLTDRAEVVEGDFRDTVPTDADVYLLCRVLADLDDADATDLLRRCRAAMGPGTRLLVVGGLAHTETPAARGMLDLHLRVVTGGRERTLDHTRRLLAAAGLEVERVVHSADRSMSLVEAVPGGGHP